MLPCALWQLAAADLTTEEEAELDSASRAALASARRVRQQVAGDAHDEEFVWLEFGLTLADAGLAAEDEAELDAQSRSALVAGRVLRARKADDELAEALLGMTEEEAMPEQTGRCADRRTCVPPASHAPAALLFTRLHTFTCEVRMCIGLHTFARIMSCPFRRRLAPAKPKSPFPPFDLDHEALSTENSASVPRSAAREEGSAAQLAWLGFGLEV